MHTSSNGFRIALLAAIILLPSFAAAQRSKQGDDLPGEKPSVEGDELVIKVYRVNDLIVTAPNYAYEGTFLPGLSHTAPGANLSTPSVGGGMMGGMGGGGMGGMGGGGMGGMGGGMGGMMGATGGGVVRNDLLAQVGAPGKPQQPAVGSATRANVAPRPASPRITFGTLISAITSVVEPQSWDDLGGEGSIQPVGVSLAVSNTAAVHAKLGKFFEALRSENDALRSISIDAHWLSLNDEQLTKLRGGDKKRGGQGITRETLAALPEETRKASAQITCFNGQTVHLISGLMKTKLQGGMPVVGGPGDPGYQPIVTTPHLGALLQITPSVLPGDEAAMVDLHSSVTRWENQDETVKLNSVNEAGETVVQIDRLKIGAQQLATSLRAPLGRPVLVGGMSQATVEAKNAGGVERLYLIIEITAPVEK